MVLLDIVRVLEMKNPSLHFSDSLIARQQEIIAYHDCTFFLQIRTVTLVETIENENFGLKINYGKISEVRIVSDLLTLPHALSPIRKPQKHGKISVPVLEIN